jgi:peptidyl-prolyl cis-trans isomerase A (cyclophilin A)
MPTPLLRFARPAGALTATLALLSACGGGAPESTVPIVDSISTSTAGSASVGAYGQKLLITVAGSALDRGITVLAPGCDSVTQLTAAPNESNARTAFYECTVASDGTLSAFVLRNSSGISLGQASYTVPSPQVTMTISNGTTSLGDIVMTLTAAKTPITVKNFIAYVKAGFYDGVVFHRHSPDFVLQGGGYAAPLDPTQPVPELKTTNAPITLEDGAGLSNLAMTVAMARTGDPNSATSQFFINLIDNTFLDRTITARGYAVFGNVTAGSTVITAMRAAPCVDYSALLPAGDCLPAPNLVITTARQTR